MPVKMTRDSINVDVDGQTFNPKTPEEVDDLIRQHGEAAFGVGYLTCHACCRRKAGYIACMYRCTQEDGKCCDGGLDNCEDP